MTDRRSDSVTDIDLPSRSDPVVAGLSESIGGPIGQHAWLKRKFWTPMCVVLLIATSVLAFNWVQKSPCRDGAWANNMQYTRACYTDVLALYYAEHLHEGAVPYIDHPVEYPVLTGYWMGLIGLPVHWLAGQEWATSISGALGAVGYGDPINEAKLFYDLNAIGLALFGLLSVWAIVRMRPRRPWDGAMVALAPAVFVTATVNWDLLAIGICSLALFAWSRKLPGWAGVLFGLAIAAKLYPLFILGPLLLLCIRRRKMLDFTMTAAAALVTWIAVNLPVYLTANESWWKFYDFSSERGVDWGTLWYIGSHFPNRDGEVGLSYFKDLALPENIDELNTVSRLLFVVCCVGIAALILFARRPPRIGAVAFLVVAAFLLTNKVWSQQFVLWLIPLAVLARPKWGAFLAWQAAELAYFFGFYQILIRASGGKSLMPEAIFTAVSICRWVALAVLCGFVVYEIIKPEADIVRERGDDDPAGGVLADPPTPREPALAGQT